MASKRTCRWECDIAMNALEIAKYIIAYSEQIGKPVNNIRLQALLYYLQHLFYNEVKYTKNGLFYIPDVYYEYCGKIGYLTTNTQINNEIPDEIKQIVDKYSNTKTWKIISRILDDKYD